MNESIQTPQPGDQESQIPPPARPSPEEMERRFLDATGTLMQEAHRTDSLRILVDVFAWDLAKIIVWNGSRWGAGDVMRRIGDYVCKLVEREHAQAEANKAKDEGHRPH